MKTYLLRLFDFFLRMMSGWDRKEFNVTPTVLAVLIPSCIFHQYLRVAGVAT